MKADELYAKIKTLSLDKNFNIEYFLMMKRAFGNKGEAMTHTETRLLKLFDSFVDWIDEENALDMVHIIDSETINQPNSSGPLGTLLSRAGFNPARIPASCWLLIAIPSHPRFEAILDAIATTKVPDHVKKLIRRECNILNSSL